MKNNQVIDGRGKTVLISSIKPIGGGVPQMVLFVIDCLKRQNFDVKLAYYEPYSLSPDKSVPISYLPKLFFSKPSRKPGVQQASFKDVSAIGIGCWFPEFEFTNYRLSEHWQNEIDSCDFFLCVSGSNLAALPYMQAKKNFMAWVATPWLEDRQHRVSEFPWYRRWFDYAFVRPVCSILEQQINRSGTIVALSEYTQTMINQKSRKKVEKVMPMPIHTTHFAPKNNDLSLQNETMRQSDLNIEDEIKIGFVGRFQDPRKNIGLLVKAFAKSHELDPRLRLVLVGDSNDDKLKSMIDTLGVSDKVEIIEHIPNTELVVVLQKLSLFVIPSYQEGLCIAALEAMSCGVPVISTRCGGPENYIIDGENGYLVDSSVSAMQTAISQIIEDSAVLNEYSKYARKTVVDRFSYEKIEQKFWQYFSETFDHFS